MTTSDLIQDYLTYLKDTRNYAQLTITNHKRIIALWSRFIEKEIKTTVTDVFTDDILSWITYRRGKKVVCDASINAELCIIRTFYEYLHWYNIIPVNPACAIPQLVCAPPKEQDYLTIDECFKLLDVFDREELKGLRNYVIVAMFWSTGIRKSELHSLNGRDVNFDEAYITIRKGKGGKQRQIFLNDRILQDLKDYREKWGINPDAPLFRSVKPGSKCADENKRLIGSRIEEIIRKSGKKAGIMKAVCPLALRHTFATHMYEAGISIADIKEIMGHDDETETTVYIHVTIDAVRSFLHKHIANHPCKRRA